MDLKFFEGKIILHLIDHLSRFSAAAVCHSKEPEQIIGGIMKAWITIFGPPEKFLVDNGGESANEKFLEMCESLNIRVMHTAAEYPWSNGLVERHNGTLAETLHKITYENKNIPFEVALAWAVQAKNSLGNVHGFSPCQLAIGYTPQLPSILVNKPPALNEPRPETLIAKNLQAMQSALEGIY